VEAIKKANHGTLPPQYDPDSGVFPDKLTTYQEILDAPEYEIKGRTRKGGFSSTAGKFLDEESVRQLKDTP
jgi:hypothetical protein